VSLLRRIFRRREAGGALSLLLVVAGFGVSTRHFLSLETWATILTVSAELGIVAAGMTILMVSGEFDLSVGATFALGAMLAATLLERGILGGPAAVLAGLLAGAAIGLLNGWVTLRSGIPSFIATLGALMFWRGVVLAFTGGWPVTLSQSPRTLAALAGPVGDSGLRLSCLWWLGSASALAFLLGRTAFGNHALAAGGKPEAARALGVPVDQVKLRSFVLAGALAALGGLVQLARMESMSPTYGTSLELEAIAAAVIGGTSLAGGQGTVLGTVLGSLLMGVLNIGLVLAGAPAYWYRSFVGVLIVLAVVVNAYATRALARA